MEKMTKTPDSCILNDVPRMHWKPYPDSEADGSPFPICLHTVLNYVGHKISYAEAMAFPGLAFRMLWQNWNFIVADIRWTYEEPMRPHFLAMEALGRSFKISEKNKGIDKKEAIALIKSEIDSGRPVIALGIVGPPEANIITGYKNNGKTVLGWSLYNDEWKRERSMEEGAGFFEKTDWNAQGIIAVGEKTDTATATPVKMILENALHVMTRKEVYPWGNTGEGLFHCGQDAYEGWATAVETDKKIGYFMMEQLEARRAAADYMRILAESHTSMASELTEIAELLGAAGEIADVIRKFHKDGNFDEIVPLIRKAAQHEKNACAILKTVVHFMLTWPGNTGKRKNIPKLLPCIT